MTGNQTEGKDAVEHLTRPHESLRIEGEQLDTAVSPAVHPAIVDDGEASRCDHPTSRRRP